MASLSITDIEVFSALLQVLLDLDDECPELKILSRIVAALLKCGYEEVAVEEENGN